MRKIYNGTPHAINVVEGATFNASIRKYVGGTVAFSIPSNGMLNARLKTEILPSLVLTDELFTERIGEEGHPELVKHAQTLPVFGKRFEGVDPLPEGYDIYIVSALYSSAAQKAGMDMSRIFTVADPVYTEDGNSFIGCRGLAPAF